MHTWHEGERVTIRDDDTLVKGTIRKVLAGRLLIIELDDGRKVRRRGL